MGFNKKAQRKKEIPAKARDATVSSLSYPPTPLLLPLLLLLPILVAVAAATAVSKCRGYGVAGR
jgi:hypothetical protein